MNTPAPQLLKPLLLLTLLLCGACATKGGQGADGDDIIGKPPARAEDPFGVTALPPPDARAPIKGSIDEPAPTPDPAPAPDPARPSAIRQCFSCVRVCDLADPSPDCAESREDMICGWGAGEEEAARTLARAECNAALDMAREMPRWSSIDGTCPVATCR